MQPMSTICFPMQDHTVFLAKKKRGFGKGYLNGYGGKRQPIDPTIEDTATRELKEESGVTATLKDLEKVAVIDFFDGDTHIFECHIFFCNIWDGDFRETKEMAAPEKYDINALPYEQMWDADRTWLPLVFSGQKIRAQSYYDNGMKRQERFEYEPL